MTKKRVFMVSFVVILAAIVAYPAVSLALVMMFDLRTTGLWYTLSGAIAFYGVPIGLIWWAYPKTHSRVEQPARFYVRRHWRGECSSATRTSGSAMVNAPTVKPSIISGTTRGMTTMVAMADSNMNAAV